MKVGTDSMILGAWVGERLENENRAESERGKCATLQILDMGTGTGVLSLMLAQRFSPFSHGRGVGAIDAVEMDANAFLQAKENFEKSSWKNRIRVYHSSIQEYVPLNNKKYDLIISNPPYFKHNQKASIESETYNERTNARSFEKLSFIDLLIYSERLLSNDGRFYLIIPFEAANAFITEAALKGLFLFDRLDVYSKEGQNPVRCILGFKKDKVNVIENHLIIYRNEGGYTDGYIELTKNYHAKDLKKMQS